MAHTEQFWLQEDAQRVAMRLARQEIARTGRALPCHVTAVSGAMLTVAFDVDASPQTLPTLTLPKAESPWIRMPTQVGDKGITLPADVSIAAIDGMGGAVPKLVRTHNLDALVFLPVSSKASPPINVNAAQVQGPDGAIIQTTQGTTSSVVTNQSGTTLTFGGNTLALNSNGLTVTVGGNTLTLTSSGCTISAGTTTIDGIEFDTHVHGGVQSGGGMTTGPQA